MSLPSSCLICLLLCHFSIVHCLSLCPFTVHFPPRFISVCLQWPNHLKRTLKRDGRDKVRVVGKERESEWGRWRSGGEGGEGKGRGRGVRQRAAEALSDADRDTFAPELWNCVVWNWNGRASGAVICNKFQVLQHYKRCPPTTTAIPAIPSPSCFSVTSSHAFSFSFVPLFVFSPLSLIFTIFFLAFLLPYLFSCWYPLGLLSVVSRLDSWRPALASPPQASLILIPPPSIILSSSDRHRGCEPVKEQN